MQQRSTDRARVDELPIERVLITGFGPFPGVPVNASARIALALERRARETWPALAVTAAILPTDWQQAPRLLEGLLASQRPAVALHFGVSSSACGFEIETVSYNEIIALPDARGRIPGTSCITTGGTATRRSTFPARPILDRLTGMRLPARLSRNPGRYLCNATLYRSLELGLASRPRRLTGFVHVPAGLAARPRAAGPASSLQALAFADAVAGGLAIIEVCLAHASARTQAG